MDTLPSAIYKTVQLLVRVIQWTSAGTVLGISSYFISKSHSHQHVIYWVIMSAISVLVFLPGFISPFSRAIKRYAATVDLAFSYLWLTAFIFAAQDYNWHNCSDSPPAGVSCSTKRANEALIFVAFFFTLVLSLLEGSPFHIYHPTRKSSSSEKVPKGRGSENGNGEEGRNN